MYLVGHGSSLEHPAALLQLHEELHGRRLVHVDYFIHRGIGFCKTLLKFTLSFNHG